MDFKSAEFVYKSTMVYTTSSPHLILMIYNKMLVELKKVMVHHQNPDKQPTMNSLGHAYKLLAELLNIFSGTPDPSYQQMYASHTPLADQLNKMFASQEIDLKGLHHIMQLMGQYRDAWKKAVHIRDNRSPQQKRKRPLNVRPPTSTAETVDGQA